MKSVKNFIQQLYLIQAMIVFITRWMQLTDCFTLISFVRNHIISHRYKTAIRLNKQNSIKMTNGMINK